MKGVETKLKKGNQILFNKESEELQELLELMNKQNRLTMVLWAFDCVQKPISILNEKLPETTLFDEALS
ncbi:MAG TPA: hypothetical protein PKU69_04900, partial [Bacillota bacterium]|nr:hypothetical protein [Bacillota bacterium]